MWRISDALIDQIDAVKAVCLAAFENEGEGRLVEGLLKSGDEVISLGATVDDQLVGHILFSPVTVLAGSEDPLVGLGPMAVLPAWQRKGVGTTLVEAGLERCRAAKYGGVVVLGHPAYYPRFGFRPAVEWGIVCKYPAPPEAFMALELAPGGLDRASGMLHYHPLFDSV